MLSHAGLAYNCQLDASVWQMGTHSVIGNALPTFHIASANMALFSLYSGAAGSSYPDFDPGAYIDAIGRHGITHTFVVTSMILFMLQSPTLKDGTSARSS